MQNFKFQVPDGELESIWLAGVVLLFRNVFPVGPPLQTAPQLVLWVLGSKKSEKARIHFPNWQSHKSQWHIKGSEMSYNKDPR